MTKGFLKLFSCHRMKYYHNCINVFMQTNWVILQPRNTQEFEKNAPKNVEVLSPISRQYMGTFMVKMNLFLVEGQMN